MVLECVAVIKQDLELEEHLPDILKTPPILKKFESYIYYQVTPFAAPVRFAVTTTLL
jgi:hypothetical protein